jgi:hypothetical protein
LTLIGLGLYVIMAGVAQMDTCHSDFKFEVSYLVLSSDPGYVYVGGGTLYGII